MTSLNDPWNRKQVANESSDNRKKIKDNQYRMLFVSSQKAGLVSVALT